MKLHQHLELKFVEILNFGLHSTTSCRPPSWVISNKIIKIVLLMSAATTFPEVSVALIYAAVVRHFQGKLTKSYTAGSYLWLICLI